MYIFLDESGDLGFDFKNKLSSRFFSVTILLVKNYLTFKYAIRRTFKKKFSLIKQKRKQELKGAETKLELKRFFFNQIINDQDWYLHTAILDKYNFIKHQHNDSHYDPSLTKNKIYNILTKAVLENISVFDENVIHFYVDKCKTYDEIQIFNAYVTKYLLSTLSQTITLNIEHLDSKKNAGLQAVDLFSYGVFRKYERVDFSWYSLFENRITREILFKN